MKYPDIPNFKKLCADLVTYANLKTEYKADGVQKELDDAKAQLEQSMANIKKLNADPEFQKIEPDDLESIRKLRPDGKRKIWDRIPEKEFKSRLRGAFIGRSAGCTLGSIVEFWPVEKMEAWARKIGQQFPPVEYWIDHPEPGRLRYDTSPCRVYTQGEMDGIPVDDDLAYTHLGLLILEEYGPDFTVEDVGKAWVKYLPLACTAERVALDNLKAAVGADTAGEKDNPYVQWIGADIRSDPWAYLAPGWPEKAAEFAYRDAYISHRRNGIYGEMYFSAVISAAFTMDDPMDALYAGLEEIPANCMTAEGVRWALDKKDEIKNYKEARAAVDEEFKGMDGVHTINNACLTIWGIQIGGRNLTRVISETVAMGLDNDCTAATAGSIVGAVIGMENIPFHWYEKFGNKVRSYLIGNELFDLDDLMERFEKQANRVFETQ